MKLVIDISEADYKKVKDGRTPVAMMRKAIRNGIRVPDDQADKINCLAAEDEIAKSFVEDVEAVKEHLPRERRTCEYWNGSVCTGFSEAICKYQDYDVHAFWEGVPCKIGCRKNGRA